MNLLKLSKTANFSTSARRRFIRQQQLGLVGMDRGANYVTGIKKFRGTQNIPLKTESPIVKSIAYRNYITDPNDLSYVDRTYRNMNTQAPIDIGETGAIISKTSRGIQPTQYLAKKGWSPGVVTEGTMGVNSITSHLAPLPPGKSAEGVVGMHTHPKMDAPLPSIADYVQTQTIRGMRTPTDQTPQRFHEYIDIPLYLKPKADADYFIGYQRGKNLSPTTVHYTEPTGFLNESGRKELKIPYVDQVRLAKNRIPNGRLNNETQMDRVLTEANKQAIQQTNMIFNEDYEAIQRRLNQKYPDYLERAGNPTTGDPYLYSQEYKRGTNFLRGQLSGIYRKHGLNYTVYRP